MLTSGSDTGAASGTHQFSRDKASETMDSMTPTRQSNTLHDSVISSTEWPRCEAVIEAFEAAWKQGLRPSIDEFLQGDGSLRQALLIELIHTDLEFRLKDGEPVRVESYLAKYPGLSADRQITSELIAAEFELRRRTTGVSLDEFRARFPDHAMELMSDAVLADDETRGPSGVAATTISPPWPDVPGYEILAEIGRGGMGIVYKAREPKLGRHVALKFLPAEYTRDHERLERFTREARTASGLNHPQICTIHALGELGGRPFIVMEFIDGCTLQPLIAKRPSIDEALRLVAQAARALAAAHAAGVVHRDIKPENIMLRGDGYVKVLDFGLARRLPTLLQRDPVAAADTDPGVMLGTVAYMSPEQARGEAAHSASDVFALGVVLYQLLTGRHPFEAGSAVGMLTAITTRHPLPPSRLNAEVSPRLDSWIESMLHKDSRLRPTAAEVESAMAEIRTTRPQRTAGARRVRAIVHRDTELQAMRTAFAEAEAGRGSIVCVAGEPGIGKTTLVEDFLDELATAAGVSFIGRGQCSERLAETEGYLPVIDALHSLLRADTSGSIGQLMSVVAPTWHALVAPAAADSHSYDALAQRALSQQAMLREFSGLLEETMRQQPVILFFDDVHWADVSTVDLLAHLGQRCARLRLLVLVTYRPTELLLGPHPFYRVKLELKGKGVCSELPLDFLTRDEIDRFVAILFPGHGFPADFADVIFRRTEGSPLFMADLLAYLREQGVIAQIDGRWSLARELPDLREDLPESVRSMIQRKLEQLAESDRRLLAAAAVQGHEFDSAVVAGALELDPAEVEERLQALDRVHNLVRLLREQEFASRALTLRYAFVHVLYQQALYNDLSPTRRASLAASLAATLEQLASDKSSAAAELGFLYEVGRDFYAAARHFRQATESAARVFAHHEAIALAQRGLRVLEALPDKERVRLEIPLQVALGLQLQITQGYAAPAALRAYSRARDLCLRWPEAADEFPVLWGLWLCHKVRSELDKAQQDADELFAIARQTSDPALALQAHQALGMTALCRGEQTTALSNVELVAALYDPDRHRAHAAMFGQDPGVMCKAYGAVALWLLGYPDTAQQESQRAIEMSAGHSPSTQAIALHFASMVHQLRRDGLATREYARRARAISAEHGLSFWLAGGKVLSGWALAAEEMIDGGLMRLRQGVADWRATGSVTYETYYLGLLAEVLARQRQFDEALRVLEESLALVERIGERLYEAELYRIRGETLLAAAGGPKPDTDQRAAEDFGKARDIARKQGVRSLELRAAVSLARLETRLGDAQAARRRIADLYGTFTEGLHTPDLKEAKALLDQVG
jgi:predicted ATPase/tRNA A-37 threonylcarbamoyl transferase component Bud32